MNIWNLLVIVSASGIGALVTRIWMEVKLKKKGTIFVNTLDNEEVEGIYLQITTSMDDILSSAGKDIRVSVEQVDTEKPSHTEIS